MVRLRSPVGVFIIGDLASAGKETRKSVSRQNTNMSNGQVMVCDFIVINIFYITDEIFGNIIRSFTINTGNRSLW